MSACPQSHCPSTKSPCQRPGCLRALRNRLERRRDERDQVHAELKELSLKSMRRLFNIMEVCEDKVTRSELEHTRQKLQDQTAPPVGRAKCSCVEHAIEHKDREIRALRQNLHGAQTLTRFVDDMQKKCERKSKTVAVATPPRPARSVSTSVSSKDTSQVSRPGKRGYSMETIIKGFSGRELPKGGLVWERERVFLPARHH